MTKKHVNLFLTTCIRSRSTRCIRNACVSCRQNPYPICSISFGSPADIRQLSSGRSMDFSSFYLEESGLPAESSVTRTRQILHHNWFLETDILTSVNAMNYGCLYCTYDRPKQKGCSASLPHWIFFCTILSRWRPTALV